MTRNAAKTLFHPFATGGLPLPEADRRVLFLGAEPGYTPPEDWPAAIVPVQGFRPHFIALAAAGLQPVEDVPRELFGHALVLCDKHRGRNLAWFADAIERTAPGGLIVVAGDKASGMASFARRIAAAFELGGRQSKYHGIVAWLRRPDTLDAAQEELSRRPPPGRIEDRFETAPGMFSHEHVDPGSRLLARSLPTDLGGRVADFGAGWGYLSIQILENQDGVTSLDLYEADRASLQAAMRNTALVGSAIRPAFHWHDLRSEAIAGRYDAIVMNPPFHEGRGADPDIGRDFIRAAAAALMTGGRLFLVANRKLPYEQTLAREFAAHGRLAEQEGFKVLWGQKR